jgi:hypothetical protein
MRATLFMRAIPGLFEQWTTVPRRFYQRDNDDGSAIVMKCPCGGRPRLDTGATLRCPNGCNRVYSYAGRGRLLVAQAEAETEAQRDED